MAVRSKIYLLAFVFLIMGTLFVEEVEGRRKILRGRKTINRTYYKELGIPAWAVIVCVGFAMILISVGIYVVTSKFYIGDLSEARTKGIYANP